MMHQHRRHTPFGGLSRCELKRRKAGLNKGPIPIDFKACTMTCLDEVIDLTATSI